jgi:hypothetical protein
MRRTITTVAFLASAILWLSGCCLLEGFDPSGSLRGVSWDANKFGTGEPALSPANNLDYINGEPTDLRGGKR